MVDRMAYEQSQIDWQRLRSYARKVAQECRRPLEKPISYTTTEILTTTVKVPTLFGLSSRTEQRRAERQQVHQVLGAHWSLGKQQTNGKKTSKISGGQTLDESWNSATTIALLPDGSLMYAWTQHDYRCCWGGGPGFQQLADDWTGGAGALDDREALTLDHRQLHRETRISASESVWGDMPGPLVRHAKGVGLSMALKSLLST